MTDTITSLTFGALFGCVTVYTLLASVEFGGAILLLAGRRLDPDRRLLGLLLRYMGPTWETTATFLVLVVVGYALAFPSAIPVLATPFLAPLSVALIAMVVRVGCYIALYTGGEDERDPRVVGAFAVSSLVCPLALSSFFAIWEGADGIGSLVSSPLLYAVAPLALLVPLAAGGAVLGVVARRSDPSEAALGARLRLVGVAAALCLPLAGIAVRFALAAVDREHLSSLEGYWWVLGISELIGLAGVALLWSHAPRRWIAGALALAAQFAVALTAYGATEGPTLGPGRPPLQNALNSGPSARWLVASAILGAVILVPSLVVLLSVIRPWQTHPAPGEH